MNWTGGLRAGGIKAAGLKTGGLKNSLPAPVVVLGITGFALIAVLAWRLAVPALHNRPSLAPNTQLQSQSPSIAVEEKESAENVRFLLDRVKRDPEDFLIQNMLASSMLQKVRETGSGDYLEAARRASRASLASVPPERNFGGLSARARVEMAEHDFVAAERDGLRLTQLDPGTINSWGVLTDALLELGEYAKADASINEMRKLGTNTAETEIRVGRLLFLQGDTAAAQKHLFRALAFALNIPAPPHETVAWCRWQLGEMAFSVGDYRVAERYYQEALATYPGYVQALASLGRVQAASGDLPDAIKRSEEAVRRFPDPTFVAGLGDLYHLAGKENEAQMQFALVQQIGRLSALNGARYNRQIAIFCADHDRNLAEAYDDAVREYKERRDIYGADTLAWAALKFGKLPEARKAISAALRLTTRDAKLYYHAGMIARACGNRALARKLIERALNLSPSFDPLQARLAKSALNN